MVRGVIQQMIHAAMVTLAVAGSLLPKAHADLIQCPYPDTFFYFDFIPGIGLGRGFVCNGPMEMESQHWHSELGGYSTSANIGGNMAFPGLQGLNGGLTIGFGITIASGTWRCPDERYESAEPTIIGTWNKERPKPSRCIPIRRAPLAIGAPWPPETDVNIKVSWPPEAPPQPITDLPPTIPVGPVQEQAPPPVPAPGPPPAVSDANDPLPNTPQGG